VCYLTQALIRFVKVYTVGDMVVSRSDRYALIANPSCFRCPNYDKSATNVRMTAEVAVE
jgi:hypothetical protein